LKHSFEWIEEHYRKNGQFSAAPVKEALGIESTLSQASIVQAALDAEVEYLSGALNRAFGQQLNKQTAVGWSSTGHTSECVELFAFGPGGESLPAFFKNCDLFPIMTDALGLRV
jgi:alkaline phosphatase